MEQRPRQAARDSAHRAARQAATRGEDRPHKHGPCFGSWRVSLVIEDVVLSCNLAITSLSLHAQQYRHCILQTGWRVRFLVWTALSKPLSWAFSVTIV
eukprot:6177602-Pleurochrysis_carterae.AAC.1